MQFRTPDYCCSARAFPAPGTAQTTPAPPAIARTVVAATKLPTVTDVPLHFKAVSVTLEPDEKSSVSAANGILYQMSGSTEVVLDGEAKRLNAGEGLFIAGATRSLRHGGQRRAIDFPPLLPCSGYGLGSACRDGTCYGERIISHGESDPRPEARRL
jgi:hypothetical protein